jgi:hypothetical protein
MIQRFLCKMAEIFEDEPLSKHLNETFIPTALAEDVDLPRGLQIFFSEQLEKESFCARILKACGQGMVAPLLTALRFPKNRRDIAPHTRHSMAMVQSPSPPTTPTPAPAPVPQDNTKKIASLNQMPVQLPGLIPMGSPGMEKKPPIGMPSSRFNAAAEGTNTTKTNSPPTEIKSPAKTKRKSIFMRGKSQLEKSPSLDKPSREKSAREKARITKSSEYVATPLAMLAANASSSPSLLTRGKDTHVVPTRSISLSVGAAFKPASPTSPVSPPLSMSARSSLKLASPSKRASEQQAKNVNKEKKRIEKRREKKREEEQPELVFQSIPRSWRIQVTKRPNGEFTVRHRKREHATISLFPDQFELEWQAEFGFDASAENLFAMFPQIVELSFPNEKVGYFSCRPFAFYQHLLTRFS